MKVVIVDENDNPIGLAERDQWEDGAIHRVSALWLTNSKGEVLLARRSLAKRHAPGKWGPAAAGTVDEGETYEINVVKETEEEIGVRVRAEDLRLGPKFLLGTSDNRRFTQWYAATMDVPIEALRLEEAEVAEARWVPVEEFRKWIAEKPDDFVRALTMKEFLDAVLPE